MSKNVIVEKLVNKVPMNELEYEWIRCVKYLEHIGEVDSVDSIFKPR